MKNEERYKKSEYLCSIKHDIEGNINDVIKKLHKLKKEFIKNEIIFLEIDIEYRYNDESDDIILRGIRYETDEEYSKRIEKENKAKLTVKKRKLAALKRKKTLYENLKKEFEGG